ncbi:TonB-dependent receptor [uncultured Sphingomonas sp.]|uniref:TonB-dependent receptor n=1 Tax=unclassified Sphingomonas TaxID=196159 RepID=UPI0025EE6C23|nr:TonB-dependent receptor [uncultured Sphingomonas sp.]
MTAFAVPAAAQDAGTTAAAPGSDVQASAEASSDETGLGDIVVTAQKRSERLQDVPLAVSVVSGDAIAQLGGVNLENAQYLVPTMNFRKSGTTINQSLFLRGVGTSTFSIAGEPSISTVVDGVVYSRAGEAFSDLVDIDRMEVLRGPQGTLFGKNASAGVINIVTRRPGDEFGGYVEGSYYTGGDEYRVRGAVDLPLAEGIKSRFTGFYGSWDGNIRNIAHGGRRVNGYEHWGVRGMIVADPTPDLQFTLIGDYREAKDDCCAEVIGTPATGLAAQLLPDVRGDKSRTINQDLITRTNEKSWGVSLQADWTLGTQTITSITAYRDYRNEEIRDGDWLPAAYVGLNQLHDFGPQTGDTFSQEIRLTSPSNQFLEYVVGAFYSRAYSERSFRRDDIVCNTVPASTPTSLIPCTTPGLSVTRPTGTAVFGSTFKNLAFFGQATLNLTDRFRVIGGIRYTADQLDVFHSRVTALAGPGINPNFDQGVFDRYQQLVASGVSPTAAQTQAVAASNGIPWRGKTTNDNWSGKAGVQFDIVRESTAYATYSRGYKGPAFNIFYNLSATGTNVIEPETADSYEIGVKNTLFDGRLVLNLAAFYAKYNNYQANNPDEVAGVLVTRFTNAGTISTRGVELDVLVQPVRDLSISGGVAYTDAHVDQFKLPTNGTVGSVIPSGTQLGAAVKWKGSVAADYRIRTGGAVDFGLGTQISAQTKQTGQFDANPVIRELTQIPGYTLVNLSASVMDADDRFRLTAQVKNLFDQSFPAAITSGGPGGAYRYIIPREADRYYGITGRINF